MLLTACSGYGMGSDVQKVFAQIKKSKEPSYLKYLPAELTSEIINYCEGYTPLDQLSLQIKLSTLKHILAQMGGDSGLTPQQIKAKRETAYSIIRMKDFAVIARDPGLIGEIIMFVPYTNPSKAAFELNTSGSNQWLAQQISKKNPYAEHEIQLIFIEAVKNNRSDDIGRTVGFGASPDALFSVREELPLIKLVANKHFDAAKRLLNLGAKANIHSRDGRALLDIARENGAPADVIMLIEEAQRSQKK
jgi:hypothetical protein